MEGISYSVCVYRAVDDVVVVVPSSCVYVVLNCGSGSIARVTDVDMDM